MARRVRLGSHGDNHPAPTPADDVHGAEVDAAPLPAAERPGPTRYQWMQPGAEPPLPECLRSMARSLDGLPAWSEGFEAVETSTPYVPSPIIQASAGPPGMGTILPSDAPVPGWARSRCPDCIVLAMWGAGQTCACVGWYCRGSCAYFATASDGRILTRSSEGTFIGANYQTGSLAELRRRAYLWGLVPVRFGYHRTGKSHAQAFLPARQVTRELAWGRNPCPSCVYVGSVDHDDAGDRVKSDIYVDLPTLNVVRVIGPWARGVFGHNYTVRAFSDLPGSLSADDEESRTAAERAGLTLSEGASYPHTPIILPATPVPGVILLPRGAEKSVVSVSPELSVSSIMAADPDRVVTFTDPRYLNDGKRAVASPQGRTLFRFLVPIVGGRPGIDRKQSGMQVFELHPGADGRPDRRCLPVSVNLWNVHRNGDVCWGEVRGAGSSPRSLISSFLASPVNADLTYAGIQAVHNCKQHECPRRRPGGGGAVCQAGGHRCPEWNTGRHRHGCANYWNGEPETCREAYLRYAARPVRRAAPAAAAPGAGHAAHTCRVSPRTGNRINGLACNCCQGRCACPPVPTAATASPEAPAPATEPGPVPCPCCHGTCACHVVCACFDGECDCVGSCACCDGSCECLREDDACEHPLGPILKEAHERQVSTRLTMLPVDPYGDAFTEAPGSEAHAVLVVPAQDGNHHGWLAYTDHSVSPPVRWAVALVKLHDVGDVTHYTVTAPETARGQTGVAPLSYDAEPENDDDEEDGE